jgi:hypothetical protein
MEACVCAYADHSKRRCEYIILRGDVFYFQAKSIIAGNINERQERFNA